LNPVVPSPKQSEKIELMLAAPLLYAISPTAAEYCYGDWSSEHITRGITPGYRAGWAVGRNDFGLGCAQQWRAVPRRTTDTYTTPVMRGKEGDTAEETDEGKRKDPDE
jgi:hypothetical protein